MEILKQRLETTIESIDKTTEMFYQNNEGEGYKKLQALLLDINITINEVFTYKQQGNSITINENELVEVLNKAMDALEKKDTLLLADIFVYELKELFCQIIKEL